jgi:repressor LexA
MESLTPRQQQILELIQDHIAETGYPPTRKDIARIFGFSSANAAEDHLRALEKKGYIEILPGVSRGVRLVGPASDGIPVIGQVAAGSPLLAQENISRHCNIDPTLFYPRAHYFLEVKGLSMINAGILEGDLLAVHRTTEAQKGQIIVARIGNEVTVKRFYRRYNRVSLLAENPDFAPIEVNLKSDDFAIEGLAVGVLRNSL